MKCRDCPYGQEDFNKYSSYVNEEDIENCIWCDKVGGKVYCFGHCSDWYEKNIKSSKKHSNKNRRNKYERNLKYQNHLKYLYEIAGGYYPTPVRYTDEVWIKGVGYIENTKPYYQRLYRSKRSKYLKKQSNRKIRRYKYDLHNGYQHIHKLYDFWWQYS